jgi:hypothetical protein
MLTISNFYHIYIYKHNMSCNYTGRVRLWSGQNYQSSIVSSDLSDNGAIKSNIPVLTIVQSTENGNTMNNISVTSGTTENNNGTAILLANTVPYGKMSLEKFGIELNKLKAISISPGTTITINYNLVSIAPLLCDHDKGPTNNGYTFTKTNLDMIKPFGVGSPTKNNNCITIGLDELVNLSSIGTFDKNRVVSINAILVTPYESEHFDDESIVRKNDNNNDTFYLIIGLCVLILLWWYFNKKA